jgi:abortive infection bacteriophage resistance protein
MEGQPEIPLKPPKTFEEQLSILQNRGLQVTNPQKAITILSRLNYYRFSAYALTFKENDTYLPDITFEHLYRHYEFDRKLRILLIEIIEPIEIAFRTHIAYLIAHNYGAEGHSNPNNFRSPFKHLQFLKETQSCINKNTKDLFVRHHMDHYNGRFPVWVALEAVTFGVISKLFSNLITADKKKISREYYSDVRFNELENWLQCLTVLRNKCAHYSRLYNCNLTTRISLPLKYDRFEIDTNKLFSVLIAIKHLSMSDIWNPWLIRLQSLIEEYDDLNLDCLGFKEHWSLILKMPSH